MCSYRLVRNLAGFFTTASHLCPHACFLEVPPPRLLNMLYTCRRDLGSLQQQGDTAACAPQAMHRMCTAPGDWLQGWGGLQSQKSVQMGRHLKTHPISKSSIWGKTCRKEGGGMLAPPPQSVWQRGHQDSSRFYHEVHAQVFCYYRNPVPLTM